MDAVYRADNRSKVEKDEATAKAQEDAATAKHTDAEREFRRQLLLQRNGLRVAPVAAAATGEAASAVAAAAPTASVGHINFWSKEEALQSAEHPEVAVSDMRPCCMHGQNITCVHGCVSAWAPVMLHAHVRIWNLSLPQCIVSPKHKQAEKREMSRRRGKAEEQTTDAKFDMKFKLAYQMADEQVRAMATQTCMKVVRVTCKNRRGRAILAAVEHIRPTDV